MSAVEPVGIGLVGCGTISGAYLRAAATFDVLDFVGCADIDPAAAKKTEETFGVPAMPVEALLERDDVEVVLNLTIPAAHGEVNLAALEAGKHAYCEKPFGLDVAEGRKVLATAEAAGLRVGCAPDTFLGGGHQTVRGLIDAGAIGKPVAGTAFMMGPGHESWHPNPAFYYQPGGGPLFDMGPYYLTALVHALGPVKRVAAITSRGRETRVIGSKPRAGEVIDVDVDTHTAGTLEFQRRLRCDRRDELRRAPAQQPLHRDPRHRCQPVVAGSQRLRRQGARLQGPRMGGTPADARLHRQHAQHRPRRHVHGHPHRSASPLQRRTRAACPGDHGRVRRVLDRRRGTSPSWRAARTRPAPLPTGLADGALD